MEKVGATGAASIRVVIGMPIRAGIVAIGVSAAAIEVTAASAVIALRAATIASAARAVAVATVIVEANAAVIRIGANVRLSVAMTLDPKARVTVARDVAEKVVGATEIVTVIGTIPTDPIERVIALKPAGATVIGAIPIDPIETVVALKAAGLTPVGCQAAKPTFAMTSGIAWPMGLPGSTPGHRAPLAKVRSDRTVVARAPIARANGWPKGPPGRLVIAVMASRAGVDAAGAVVAAVAEVVAHARARPRPTVPVS